MTELSDLESIVKKCSDVKAKKNGTSVKWVDLYAKNPDMARYQDYKVSMDVRNLQFQPETPIEKPLMSDPIWYDNGTTLEQTYNFTRSMEETESYSISVTESLKVGYKLKLDISIPFFGDAGGEWSAEVDFSSTQTQSKTRTRSWLANLPIRVPPNRSVRCTLTIIENKLEVPWTADILCNGYSATWYNEKIDFNHNHDFHNLWFPWISWIKCLDDDDLKELVDDHDMQEKLKNYFSDGYGNLIYKAKGKFIGVKGISSSVRINEFPLRPTHKRDIKEYKPADIPLRSYIIVLPETQHGD